jgi:uncharacterized repeat protein (TIGR01451 family)
MMKRLKLSALILSVLLAGFSRGKAQPELSSFDQRYQGGFVPAGGSLEQKAAEARLKALLPHARVDFDELTSAPKWVASLQGTLTGPRGEGRSVSSKVAGQWPETDPDRPVKAFLAGHPRLFGYGSEALAGATRKREFVTAHNGLRTTVWEQTLDGIPVHQGVFIAHVTRDGELAAVSSAFLADPARAADTEHPKGKLLRNQPAISARQAVAKAIETIGESVPDNGLKLDRSDVLRADLPQQFSATGLPGPLHAGLVWLPLSSSRLRLCWSVEVVRQQRGEVFQVLVDAQTGQAMTRRKLTYDLREATYRVFTTQSPAPMSPGWPQPSTNQPPLVDRGLVTLAAVSTNASPAGWIADADNETRGNNVDAHTDLDADNQPDLPRPRGSPFRVFDFPLDLGLGPETYSAAATVQLFYWCNWMHDKLYELGFTEAAGNFQKDNFGRGGQDADPLLADAQDGSGFNNANFTPTPDGRSPRIQMFVFNGPTPLRDGDLDAEIVLHEYTHGLSDRLLGGGAGISQWQTYGMGEGWSDFYALSFLTDPNDPPGSTYPVAAYASYLFSGLKESYYFGIRRYPVCTDLLKNPLTFKDADPAQASYHLGVPRNPIVTSSASEVHALGEIWCAALWEVRANLIRKLGSTNGNQLALQLVTDGMKLSPPNPTFIQARNAILLADVVMNNGANRGSIWAGFAKRGMGYSATGPDNSTTSGVREAFDEPDNLLVTPTNTFIATGVAGGPFLPAAQTYTLVNASGAFLNWSVSSAPLWTTVAPAGGGLLPGASNTVTVTINPLANTLGAGAYQSAVVFLNQSSGQPLSVPLYLQVLDNSTNTVSFLTEIFNGQGDFDLDNTTVTFGPVTGSGAQPGGESYAFCAARTSGLPTDPSGGEVLPMADDCYVLITLADGKELSLFGARTNQVLVGSNGDVLFNVPTNLGYALDPTRQMFTNYFYPQDSVYFQQPRVAPLYVDLNPGVAGTVSWKQLWDRVAVTWQSVPEYGLANSNTFQVEWFFDGTIRFTYAGVAPAIGASYTTPKVGLVADGGMPPGFAEANFSSDQSCLPKSSLLLPTLVTEGQGPWDGAVLLRAPSSVGVEVQFTLSDTNATIDPNPLLILPGDISATFQLYVDDDHLLLGTRAVAVTANAPGYAAASATVQVADQQTAVLAVTVPPRAVEGQGLIYGKVSMDQMPDGPIAVELSSTAPALVQVPPAVIVPPGTNSVQFAIWVGDDSLISGPQAVGILAHVANWEDDADAIIVADNESTNLTLSLPPQVMENAGLQAKAGLVTLGGYLAANLVVSLSSDNTNVLQVPGNLTIEAGKSSGAFDLNLIDDNIVNGPRLVTVQATAPGFAGASFSIKVLDDETPSYPTNPSPAHLATRVSTDLILTWKVLGRDVISNMTFDVYLGTNPVPGTAELLGRTSTNTWSVKGLSLNSAYYWQIVEQVQGVRIPGPVWQFATVGLHHFAIGNVGSPQVLGVPFPVTVMAVDEVGNPATGFSGSARLQALASVGTTASVVIAEVDAGASDRVEFVNVSGHELSLEGWQIAFYDWNSWPAPKVVFTIPTGTIAQPGDLFQIRRNSIKPSPGVYPIFYLPADLSWNNNPTANPIAVLLMDSASNVVDFVCAVDADPTQISAPVPIPGAQWKGAPVPANTTPNYTYQRVGSADHNDLSDWMIATNGVGKTNQGLTAPFYDQAAVDCSPGQLPAFTNGLWAGLVRVGGGSSRVFLQVDDAGGRSGTGNVFTLVLADNLSVEMAASPGRKTVANPFNYSLTVKNAGPSAAHGVVLLDYLPPEASFLGATSSQGTTTNLVGVLVCDLGTIPADSSASVILTLSPRSCTLLTNRAVVSRIEPEAYTGDNEVAVTTPVSLPLISVRDAGALEGNEGTANLQFKVDLSEPSHQAVSVGYFTTDGTATAGSDYAATAGLVQFPPGQTNAIVAVSVFGDRLSEPNETLFLTLTNATNALIVAPWAVGTITNDDTRPFMAVSDVTVLEGDAGFTNAVFQVGLSTASGMSISVNWETTNGTAVAGLDYLPGSGRLLFQPGETNHQIQVPVLGNTFFQSNRDFFVNLAFPLNATLMRSRVEGTIVDDDAWRLHHFAWSFVASEQFVQEPFQVTLTAKNALNETFTGFSGTVAMRGSHSNRTSVVGVGQGAWEAPFGTLFHDSRLQVIYRSPELTGAGRISALALEVLRLPGQTLSNWTIRLRHTPLASYANPLWETDWTVVYQAAPTLASTGWVTFQFQTPFDYNGVDNLMVDFSFNNSSYSSDGLCSASDTNVARALYFRTDSVFGDPLQWSGGDSPPPTPATRYPNARFSIEQPSALSPSVISNFVSGVWSGPIRFSAPAGGMVLHALDAEGHAGASDPFDVFWRDSDGDGMPDAWEVANKLDPLNPADASLDSDEDGLSDLEEYLAGTDPHDASSTLNLRILEPVTGDYFSLGFVSQTNRHYVIESSATVGGGGWFAVSPVYQGQGGLMWVTNRFYRASPTRFYRVKALP